MKKILTTSIVFLSVIFKPYAQNYSTLKVKEEFDLFNSYIVNQYNPCGIAPNSDQNVYGDGMSFILDGYITMYKTTKDKAYLYKFIIQSICILENRHDFSGINSEPRWSEHMYQDGYILGALARFVYLIKNEENSLQQLPIYQFSEISNNTFGLQFNTFIQYANWLQIRVSESLIWFHTNGFWDNVLGYKKGQNLEIAAPINMQIGFGRALLFIGLAEQNYDFLTKANTIALLFKGNISFYDPCEDEFCIEPVFRTTSNNAYWWYHKSWSIETQDCGTWWPPQLFWGVPSVNLFREFKEDISHGAVVTFLALDYLNFQPLTPFNSTDMVRFRNMFTKNIYDGNGGFHEAVDGTNTPVFPPYQLDFAAINYMPFENYDAFDNTATTPNVYDIIMDFYSINIANHTAIPSLYEKGMSNKGHSEVVQAQWEKECVNLTLFNRNVVYNQDFYVKNNLTIDPTVGIGTSYAEPITSNQEFTVESGITANFVAGESIVFKTGTHFKAGSNVHAYISPNLCSDGQRISPNVASNDSIIKDNNTNGTSISTQPINVIGSTLTIFPNPFTSNTTIQLSINRPCSGSLKVIDEIGRIVYNSIYDRLLNEGIYVIPIPLNDFPTGIYYCILTIDNEITRSSKLIKM